jgi:hypothetical protein
MDRKIIPEPFQEIDQKGLTKLKAMFAGLGIDPEFHAKFGVKTVFMHYSGVYRLYSVAADGKVWARKEFTPSAVLEASEILAKYAANPSGFSGKLQIYYAGSVKSNVIRWPLE